MGGIYHPIARARSKKPGFFPSLRLSPNILAKTRFLATFTVTTAQFWFAPPQLHLQIQTQRIEHREPSSLNT